MLVPVIGLVQVGSQAMADRYTYLTQIGLYIAAAWGAEHVSRRWRHRYHLWGPAAAIIVAVLVCRSWQQTSYWKNDETLWTHTLPYALNNTLARGNLGRALVRRGRFDEAIAQYQAALEINPAFVEIRANLGSVLATQGRLDEAIAQYQAALDISPGFIEVHANLAKALAARGRLDEAIQHYRIVLRWQSSE